MGKKKAELGVIFLLVNFAVPSLSFSWNEPDGLMDVKFGAEPKEVRECPSFRRSQELPISAPPSSFEAAQRALERQRQQLEELREESRREREYLEELHRKKEGCWKRITGGRHKPFLTGTFYIGDIPVEVTASLLDGKVESVTVNFSSGLASTLLQILTQRYGQPTELKVEPWRSRAGATFSNTVAAWKGERVSVTFRERGSRIDEGYFLYVTPVWQAKVLKEREETIKKGVEQLR